MQKKDKNLILFLFLFGLMLSLANQPSFAAYDIVNAKTVVNENLNEEKESITPTYNDPEIPNFSEENSVASKIERNTRNFIEKLKRRKNPIQQEDSEDGLGYKQEDNEPKVISPRMGENEIIDDKNRFKVNADKITYDEKDGNVYATGNVEIIASAQKVTLKAKEAILDRTNQTIKLYDDVRIIKDGLEMVGEYMLVDLNEQNILMDNPTLDAYSFEIKAQEGFLIENDIQMLNGNIKATQDTQIAFQTRGFQQSDDVDSFYGAANDKMFRLVDTVYSNDKKQAFTIDTKEVVIESFKDHDTVTLKGANIYYNTHRIIRNTDVELYTDKSRQVIEVDSLEAGSIKNFGAYVGYGFVTKLPKGHVFKLTPVLTHKSKFGVGIIGRYKTQNGAIEAGINTSTSDLVASGKYNFGRGISLRYGRHAYIPEGFFGARRSGYAAQLQYVNGYNLDDVKANFDHGIYAGIYSDYKKHNQEHAYATTRFRYMAQLTKRFLSYENKEQDLLIRFSGVAQAAATLYGSGQDVGIVRVGPMITTKLKRWDSNICYFLAGTHGDSPFYFDKYMYGKQSIYFNEKFRLTDKLAIGFRGNFTPNKDNWEQKALTESKLYVVAGPEAVKLAFAYDFVRENCQIDFLFLVGTKSTRINFEKLITKNMDRRVEKQKDFYQRPTWYGAGFDELL